MAHNMHDANYEFIWRKQFSGLIPKNWTLWHNPYEDFKQAGELKLQLNDTLISAGITHPVHHVGREVGASQKLNLDQLVALLSIPNMPGWGVKQVLEAQRKMGLSESDIIAAEKRARDIRAKMEKKKSVSKLSEPLKKLYEGK